LAAKHIVDALRGGIALAIEGFVRCTKGVELLVGELDLERALEVARSRGFVPGGGGGNLRFGT
jgi:hypothetical protein